jgi:hypothetical protein
MKKNLLLNSLHEKKRWLNIRFWDLMLTNILGLRGILGIICLICAAWHLNIWSASQIKRNEKGQMLYLLFEAWLYQLTNNSVKKKTRMVTWWKFRCFEVCPWLEQRKNGTEKKGRTKEIKKERKMERKRNPRLIPRVHWSGSIRCTSAHTVALAPPTTNGCHRNRQ